MGLGRLFKPKNDLILLFKDDSPAALDEMGQQLKEVKQYYRFRPLSYIAREKACGNAYAVVLEARKSFLHQIKNCFLDLGIPVTLMVRPECIGLNRLPLLEEVSALLPQAAKERQEEWSTIQNDLWLHPEKAETWLKQAREDGLRPNLNEQNPLHYYCTWKNLIDLSPAEVELGFYISDWGNAGARAQANLDYLRTQSGRPISVAYQPSLNDEPKALQARGIEAILTPKMGAVEPNTELLSLPHWVLEKETSREG